MQIIIYDKTEKGREEIATRKWHLPSRMRSLLVLIDGKKSENDLIQKIGGLGLNLESLQKLQDEGFIQRVAFETPAPLDSELPPSLPAVDQAIESEMILVDTAQQDNKWHAEIDAILDEESKLTRVQLMQRFLTEAIKEHLGIKGFFMLRKVQKATTLKDVHELRSPFVSAILYAKGKDKAIDLRDQFDQRLYVKFSIDAPEFLDN